MERRSLSAELALWRRETNAGSLCLSFLLLLSLFVLQSAGGLLGRLRQSNSSLSFSLQLAKWVRASFPPLPLSPWLGTPISHPISAKKEEGAK